MDDAESRSRAVEITKEYVGFTKQNPDATDSEMAILLTGESAEVITWIQKAMQEASKRLKYRHMEVEMFLLGAWMAHRSMGKIER